MKDPGFIAEYRQRMAEIVEHTTRKMQTAALEAVDVLQSVMSDTSEPATARISASKGILEYSIKMAEMIDVQRRMAALEKIVSELEERGQ